MCNFTGSVLKRHGYWHRLLMEIENPTWRAIAMPLEEFIITVFCWVDEGVEAVTNEIE